LLLWVGALSKITAAFSSFGKSWINLSNVSITISLLIEEYVLYAFNVLSNPKKPKTLIEVEWELSILIVSFLGDQPYRIFGVKEKELS